MPSNLLGNRTPAASLIRFYKKKSHAVFPDKLLTTSGLRHLRIGGIDNYDNESPTRNRINRDGHGVFQLGERNRT